MTHAGKEQLAAAAALLLMTFFWGAAFLLVKMTIAEMNLYFFLFLRFGLASALMFLLFFRRNIAADRSTIASAFVLALFLAAAFIAQTEGLRFTSAANSALITCLYMVFIPLAGFLFQRVRVARASIAGALLAFAGMYLLTSGSLTGANRGDVITLLCAVASTWHFILTSRYSHRHRLVPLVSYQFLFTAVICGIVAAAQRGFTASVPAIGIATIALTAVFATVIAFLVQTRAQRILSPTRAGVICSMEAVFGACIPWAVGAERPTWLAALGAAMMVAGMIASELAAVLGVAKRAVADRAGCLSEVETSASS
jgi:drug/metabolite transporter (DMT)-like permease